MRVQRLSCLGGVCQLKLLRGLAPLTLRALLGRVETLASLAVPALALVLDPLTTRLSLLRVVCVPQLDSNLHPGGSSVALLYIQWC